jgi:hypothetical protein
MTTDTSSATIPPTSANVESHYVFYIDVEHQGIRLALPALTVVGFFAGYALFSWLLSILNSDLSAGCVPATGGIIVGLLLAAVGERVLKNVWHSGRSLTLDEGGLELLDKRRGKQANSRIMWAQRINVLTWRFSVRRGSARIPKGWIMLALQLLQDDTQITLYTFMPEKSAKTIAGFEAFQLLAPRAQLESNDLSLRQKIEQRRLHKAEDIRWEDGAELRRQDFEKLMEVFTQRVPNWQEQL